MKLINSLMAVVFLSIFIHAETRGMILNHDKLVVPKDNNISSARENLDKKITQLLIKSKKIKKLSKNYLKISTTYKNYIIFKLKSIDLDETFDKSDKNVIYFSLDKINKKKQEIRIIIKREEDLLKEIKAKIKNM